MAGIPESRRHAGISRALVGDSDPWATAKSLYVWAYGVTAAIISVVMIWEGIFGGPSLFSSPEAWPSPDLASPVVLVVADSTPAPSPSPFVPFVPVATPYSLKHWNVGCQSVDLSHRGLPEPSPHYHYDPDTGSDCVSYDIGSQPNPWDMLGH